MKVEELSFDGRRFWATALDFIIHFLIGLAIYQLITTILPEGRLYVLSFAVAAYLCKDSFGGQSFGKRIMKLEIIDLQTENKANLLRCFLRNITFIISPVEIAIMVVNPERRLGDFMVGTSVEPSHPDRKKSGVPELLVVFVFFLAMFYSSIMVAAIHYTFEVEGITARQTYDRNTICFKPNQELTTIVNQELAKIVNDDSRMANNKLKIDLTVSNQDTNKLTIRILLLSNYSLEPMSYEEEGYEIYSSIQVECSDLINKAQKVLRRLFGDKWITFKSAVYSMTDNRSYKGDNVLLMPYKFEDEYTQESQKLPVVRESYYENGQLASKVTYVENQLVDTSLFWYPNGKMESEIPYKDGKQHGISRYWYENGNLESERLYTDGFFDRYIRRWDKEGNLIEVQEE